MFSVAGRAGSRGNLTPVVLVHEAASAGDGAGILTGVGFGAGTGFELLCLCIAGRSASVTRVPACAARSSARMSACIT